MSDTPNAAGWVVQFSFPQPVTNKFGAGPPIVEYYNVAVEAAPKAVNAAIASRQSTHENTETFVVRPLSASEVAHLKLSQGEVRRA